MHVLQRWQITADFFRAAVLVRVRADVDGGKQFPVPYKAVLCAALQVESQDQPERPSGDRKPCRKTVLGLPSMHRERLVLRVGSGRIVRPAGLTV